MKLLSKQGYQQHRQHSQQHPTFQCGVTSNCLCLQFFVFVCSLFLCVGAQQQISINQTTATLSEARSNLAAISLGELVFFGGGQNAGGPSSRVDICNVTSGSWTTATLSVARQDLAAAALDNLVFFAGGWDGSSNYYKQVDIYNISDGSWSTATLSQARCCLAATSVGTLVLFGGGIDNNGSTSYVVDIYNITNNTWTIAKLSQNRSYLASTSIANQYALFAGGLHNSSYNSTTDTVDIFNSSSAVWSTATLSQPRAYLAAASSDMLLFFGGGYNGTQASNVVDICNSTTQTWSNATLSQARYQLAAAAIGEIVAFGGGNSSGSTPLPVVDMYNVTNSTWFTLNLSQPRYLLAATASNASSKRLIFFGGGTNGSVSNVVDIFCFSAACLPPPPPPPPTSSPLSSPSSYPASISPSSPLSPSSTSSPVSTSPLSSSSSPTIVPAITNTSVASSQSSSGSGDLSSPTTNQTQAGAIAGIIIGVIMIVLAIAVLIFVFKRYRKQKKAKTIRLRSSQSEEHINNETHTLLTKTLPSTSVPQQIIVSANEFVIERVIGGSYGKVCIGKWNNVPVVWKYGRKKQNIDNLMSEIKTIVDLPPHPNVVQVFGVSLDTPQTFFIMEYCAGGSLSDLLYCRRDQIISNDRKMLLIRGIARGMLHLHKYDIVHGDLCARNILLTATGEPKISDYAISRILDKVNRDKNEVISVCWKAPETLANSIYNKKTDIWTFGIVVYEIVTQSEPFKNMNLIEVGVAIRDRGLTPPIPNDCPQKLREVMEMCWKKDPDQRPEFEYIYETLKKSQIAEVGY